MYAPLRHAPWHGWTPTDLIFPFFLFVVGITTELSPKRPLRIIRRAALIIASGLLLNAFPFTLDRLTELRYAGVLQRIGVVYLVAALIASRASRRSIAAIALVILAGYWAILSSGPLEPPSETIAARLDRALIGEEHIWVHSRTWDPEGVLSTIPAVATALLGVLAAPWVIGRKVNTLTVAGVLAIAAGWAWGLLFPINKNLWTSSYVLFTGGCAAVLLAGFLWLIDIRGHQRWSKPLVVYGVNPFVAFIGSGLMARLLGMIRIDGVSLQALSYRGLLSPYFPPRVASLLWALAFVFLWLAILWVLYRRRIFVRL